MQTLDDVARIALAFPGVTEGVDKYRKTNRTWTVLSGDGGGKGFAWERPFSKADLKRFGDEAPPEGPIVAVVTADLHEKEAILAAGNPAFFTIPHFNGYKAYLIQLDLVSPEDLREALTDAWLACAPPDLAEKFKDLSFGGSGVVPGLALCWTLIASLAPPRVLPRFRGSQESMATRTKSRKTARTRAKAHAEGARDHIGILGRAGFLARGVMYIVIGWIALLIAFGKTGQQADRTGALHELSTTPFGAVALWVLVIGFFGMALWRLTQALWGRPGRGPSSRIPALARTVFYAFLGYGVLEYAIGAGGPQASDQQAVDLTATLMRYPGGRVAVSIAGLVLIGVGLYSGYQYWRKRFASDLATGRMSPRTRRFVEWLGRVGGVARGIVFVTAGVFLIVAAVRAEPGQAKGIDSSLRALAATPFGPWLLVLVAAGLVVFGLFSCCESRWRRF